MNTIETFGFGHGFKITIDKRKTKCDFLETSNNTFKPYQIEKSSIKYINYFSNHSSFIKKSLLIMINKKT